MVTINQGKKQGREIWTNETFQSMLAKIDKKSCQNSEFLERNKWGMVEIGPMDEQDYYFFWGCMQIYEEFGLDYFGYYIHLRKGLYGNFLNGVEGWFNDNTIIPIWAKEESLFDLVNTLRFFGIESYQNIPYKELENSLRRYHILEQKAQDRRNIENRLKGEKTVAQKVNTYFNFSSFNATIFKQYLDSYTIKLEREITTLDKAIIEAKSAPANTYIIILFKNGKACYTGKTYRILSFIEEKSRKYNADSVYYQIADDHYVDDLLIAIKIFYDLSLSNVRPCKSNRKYATVQQACYAYRHSDSVSKKAVLSAIKDNHLRLYEIDAERNLIDKIQLEKVIRSSLGK